jgi:hypothetical protein
MIGLPEVGMLVVVAVGVAVEAAIVFGLVYFAARLAIRHERRRSV